MYRYNMTATRIGLRPHRSYVLAAVIGAFEQLAVWQERRRQRFNLARLDDRMLRDIGLSTVDVQHEISKPFWK